ncbi:hypothetical protein V6R21_23660 [Limibacter armeniacum]|uniref:hypothetical protein n=1 Tax=Limibacter armeniacum TaxID=466084 RepID=UPI002FE649A5
MKNFLKVTLVMLCMVFMTSTFAQSRRSSGGAPSSYGNTLNIGLGLGYGVPLLVNYEFDVAKDFTLAPFIGYHRYREYWGRYNAYYIENIVPIGAKGTYYLDDVFGLTNPKWDLYGAASLGFNIYSYRWKDATPDGWDDSWDAASETSALFLTVHAGAQYHFNSKLGVFLDLAGGLAGPSTVMPTVGLAINF